MKRVTYMSSFSRDLSDEKIASIGGEVIAPVRLLLGRMGEAPIIIGRYTQPAVVNRAGDTPPQGIRETVRRQLPIPQP